MRTGEKLLGFLTSLMLERFYATAIIHFEAGKVTHVQTETRRTWQYKDLPQGTIVCAGNVPPGQAADVSL